MLVQGRWLQPQHLCRWLILVPCSLPLKAKDVGHYLLVAASLACGPSAPPSLPTCLPSRHVHVLSAGSANGAAQMTRGRAAVGCWQWAWMWRSLRPPGRLTCMAAATLGGVATMGKD